MGTGNVQRSPLATLQILQLGAVPAGREGGKRTGEKETIATQPDGRGRRVSVMQGHRLVTLRCERGRSSPFRGRALRPSVLTLRALSCWGWQAPPAGSLNLPSLRKCRGHQFDSHGGNILSVNIAFHPSISKASPSIN